MVVNEDRLSTEESEGIISRAGGPLKALKADPVLALNPEHCELTVSMD